MAKRKGIVFVISAPSGAGKSTLIQKLLHEFSNFVFSISYTTRKPRTGEVDGEHYHFITEQEFQILCDKHFFAEWAIVHGEYYGTPLEATTMLLEQGKDVLFDIDVQGATQLQGSMKQGFYVFILPPSYNVLFERLCGRGTDCGEIIRKRMRNAEKEMREAHWFHVWIVNDSLKKAYDELRASYICATLSPECNPKLLERIMQDWNNPNSI